VELSGERNGTNRRTLSSSVRLNPVPAVLSLLETTRTRGDALAVAADIGMTNSRGEATRVKVSGGILF
jgi:hypothetical protein